MLPYKPDHKHLVINNTQGDIGHKGFRLARGKSVLVEEITPAIQELIDNNSVSVIAQDTSAEEAPVAVVTAPAPVEVVKEAPKEEPAKEEAAPPQEESKTEEKPSVTTNVKPTINTDQKGNRK